MPRWFSAGLVALIMSATACSASAPTSTPTPSPTQQADESSAGCGTSWEPGAGELRVVSQGEERIVRIYVPSGYEPDEAVPVVLNWHGLGASGDQQLFYSEYAAIADRERFIVAAPTGLPSPDDPMERPAWEFIEEQDPNRSDITFANDLLDALEADLCVDTSRVYSTGFSNGGYFTSALVCAMADRLAAAAAVSGAIHDETCEPSRPVPFMEIHGTVDDIVPMMGGGETVLDVDPAQAEFIADLMSNVIPDEVAEFATDYACQTEETIDVNDYVTETRWSDCDADAEVRFYAVDGVGHLWPGSTLNAVVAQDPDAAASLSATETAWEFFSQHRLNGEDS